MAEKLVQSVPAVVVAAGIGSRFGGKVPKQLRHISGRSLLELACQALAAGGCTHLILVVNQQVAAEISQTQTGFGVPVYCTPGGSCRQESVRNGLAFIADDPQLSKSKYVLIHDAVRPLVPAEVVSSVIAALRDGYQAVAPAMPVADSMRQLTEHGSAVVDRASLRAIQTPQGFDFGLIWQAHQKLANDPALFTDDLTCAEQAGAQLHLVAGSPLAMKITAPSDLIIAQALLDYAENPELPD